MPTDLRLSRSLNRRLPARVIAPGLRVARQQLFSMRTATPQHKMFGPCGRILTRAVSAAAPEALRLQDSTFRAVCSTLQLTPHRSEPTANCPAALTLSTATASEITTPVSSP